MRAYVLGFQEVDRTDIGVVGGKARAWGSFPGSKGSACRMASASRPKPSSGSWTQGAELAIDGLLDRLALLKVEDREAIRELAAAIRGVIEGIAIPEDVQEAITRFLARLGEQEAYAVRSSATAEDLPGASFAGQQDTYLNVIGKPAILKHISRCWASLFTERAVAYRLQHGFDHRKVHMAVVVQKMLFPQAAGILFTADPVTGNRKVASIEAVFGLGEALVSGLVNADGYKVRDGQVIEKAERQDRPVLTDEQIVRLARLGRQIEGHFGQPQDIEWCLVEDDFHIVQSRPITTLYPVPEAEDQGNHVYVSVGHQQMMTDPMKPLGLSLFQAGHMVAAGGRLFVDVTKQLASPAGRDVLLNVLGRSDPLVKDALTTLIERGDFIESPIELPPDASMDPNASWQARYAGGPGADRGRSGDRRGLDRAAARRRSKR